jgi:hypothetical protein
MLPAFRYDLIETILPRKKDLGILTKLPLDLERDHYIDCAAENGRNDASEIRGPTSVLRLDPTVK